MTTSLTKSTIPEYTPENNYLSPRQVPRVKQEAHENYMRSRGSLDIGSWSEQSKHWESPRPAPRVKYDVAEKSYIKNRGCMNELLGGYLNPAIDKKGPRITNSAHGNYIKNRGTFNTILHQNENKQTAEIHNPKVYYEGKDNRINGHGSVGNLMTNYGYLPQSARPVPRIKFEGANILANNRGTNASKTLTMMPASSRPSSATFFDMKP